MTKDKIDALLRERDKTHGDYTPQAEVTQALKRVVQRYSKGQLTYVQLDALEMICVKMGRILAGNPNEVDHWEDIQGYARLVAQRCL